MKSQLRNNKIVIILGPTSSGKTGLAVDLAYKYNGEIVGADSRQVYRGMDIGSGKDLSEYVLKFPVSGFKFPKNIDKSLFKKKKNNYIYNVPFHLIDVVNPNTEFHLAKFQKLAKKAVLDISDRKKLPIVVGGTGLYLQSLVDDIRLSSVKSDKVLRKKYEKYSTDRLFQILEKLKPDFARNLNNSEKNNKRRLIRYIEIAKFEPESLGRGEKKNINSSNDFLILGLAWPMDILRDRIYKRLIERIEKEGMIEEVEKLHKGGVSWKRLEGFGLEYRYVSRYLKGKISYEKMIEQLNIAIRQFAKRQMTWFKRWERQGAKIYWENDRTKIKKIIDNFLK